MKSGYQPLKIELINMLNQELSLKTTEMQRQQRIFKNVIIGLFVMLLFVFFIASFALSNSMTKDTLTRLEQTLQSEQSTDRLLSQLQAVRMHNVLRHRNNDDTNAVNQAIQTKQAVLTIAQVNDESINKEVQAWERRFNQLPSRQRDSSD